MKFLAPILLMTILAGEIHGQRTATTISFQLSFPQGDYKSVFPVTGYGLRWNIMHRPGINSPLSIGGEIGFLVTGNTSRLFDIYYLGFYDRYRVTATNNVLTLAFKARADLLPADEKIQLFVDGSVGTNLFFSSVDVSRETFFGESIYGAGNSTKGYWSFIFGPGVGVEIPLDKRREVAVVLKGTYFFGSNTRYLTDPYIDNDGNVYFSQHESRTDMIMAEAGIRLGIFNRRDR